MTDYFFEDDPEDHEPTELDNVVNNALFSGDKRRWHPELGEGYTPKEIEEIDFEAISLESWDKLVDDQDRFLISRLNLELKTPCPYLRSPPGESESFHYCGILADAIVESKMAKFNGRVASKDSAEFKSRRTLRDLTDVCLDNFHRCERYFLHKSFEV